MIVFGDWLSENKQSLNEDVYGLFYDSYRCHKNDIDRPAYLLAYQGMMQFVRLTVLQSVNKPTGFADAEWENQWLCPLRDDDKWDGIAFKCTQQQENVTLGKAAVMNIRQEVREKFVFWRQLRNVRNHLYKSQLVMVLLSTPTCAVKKFIKSHL